MICYGCEFTNLKSVEPPL